MFSIIVPTLGERTFELRRLLNSLTKQGVQLEVIIAAQGNFELLEGMTNDYSSLLNIKLLKMGRKGLSYARNEALKHASGDFLTFSDDDCWYPDNILKDVQSHVHKSQICTFQIYDFDGKQHYKKYPTSSFLRHTSLFKVFKVSSIEIFINLRNVSKEDINFDESFGLGARYPGGEEINLLIDLIRGGYRIDYIPLPVVYHKKNGHRINDKVLEVKGAFLARNFNLLSCVFLGAGFYFKKAKYIGFKLSGVSAILNGFRSFKKIQKGSE
ncbi:glycosyltransferase family 2 protein [Priestia filamentosa]|uniref:glycosyltransferase family 2 protein n=1 Tax=Priestia filamentosa TaxID=1402861 RepID=UPI001C1E5F10|nr:glycosyltransferase family 2 protein [Priestia filamentosa]